MAASRHPNQRDLARERWLRKREAEINRDTDREVDGDDGGCQKFRSRRLGQCVAGICMLPHFFLLLLEI